MLDVVNIFKVQIWGMGGHVQEGPCHHQLYLK